MTMPARLWIFQDSVTSSPGTGHTIFSEMQRVTAARAKIADWHKHLLEISRQPSCSAENRSAIRQTLKALERKQLEFSGLLYSSHTHVPLEIKSAELQAQAVALELDATPDTIADRKAVAQSITERVSGVLRVSMPGIIDDQLERLLTSAFDAQGLVFNPANLAAIQTAARDKLQETPALADVHAYFDRVLTDVGDPSDIQQAIQKTAKVIADTILVATITDAVAAVAAVAAPPAAQDAIRAAFESSLRSTISRQVTTALSQIDLPPGGATEKAMEASLSLIAQESFAQGAYETALDGPARILGAATDSAGAVARTRPDQNHGLVPRLMAEVYKLEGHLNLDGTVIPAPADFPRPDSIQGLVTAWLPENALGDATVTALKTQITELNKLEKLAREQLKTEISDTTSAVAIDSVIRNIFLFKQQLAYKLIAKLQERSESPGVDS